MIKLWRSLLLGLCLSNAVASRVASQIIPDGTTNTNVAPTDNVINIERGDRSGANLFHSFEEFSVPNGNEAFFNNQSDIVNIFSRVTGGGISEIEGLIRANGDANLFLINPAGIVFGEGAALDIGGSFTASTADSIVFSDDVEFSATPGNEPLLTINQPIGLNYGNNPGSIAVNNSNLEVDNGDLALLGGDVTIAGGQIIAPGANIELGGLTAAGQVNFIQPESTISSTSFPEGVARGDLTLTNGTNVNVQAAGGGNIRVNARNLELSGGELGESNLSAGIASNTRSHLAQAGNITITSTNNITVNQGSYITNNLEESGVGNAGGIKIATDNLSLTQGSQINSSTFGQGNGGEITISASDTISIDGETETETIPSSGIESEVELPSGTVSIDGETETEISSGIFSQVRQGAIGNSGAIDITTTNLKLTRGGKVDTSTFGQGDAGRITIDAAENILADGESQAGITFSGIFSLVLNGATGDSGDINITTSNLELIEALISNSTFARGNAGAITIDATETISADGESQSGIPSGILSLVLNGATGNSGDINITTTDLSLTRGAAVSASTGGQGDAGSVTINASDNIAANGETQDGSFSSGIFNTVDTSGVGNSGDINITTANLQLTQGGEVNASTLGRGNAGTITINASGNIAAAGRKLSGSGSGISSLVAPNAIGNAGGININANHLSLTNGAEISVQSLGQGEAGDLNIQTLSLALLDAASLLASTPVGTGGNINLKIDDRLTLQDNSTISAQALENANGGNIDLDANFVIAQPNQNNDIIASAADGTGGIINITTNAIFGLEARSSTPENNTNDLDASSELGVDGTIEINELEANPAQGLEELPIEIIDVTGLVAQNLCQQGQGSEFVVTGKGGAASSPTQARDGSVSEVDLVKPVPFSEIAAATQAQAPEGSSEIVEAQGWIVNDRGMVELVASKTDVDSSTAQPNIQVCHQQ